jgi:hypothetical protein
MTADLFRYATAATPGARHDLAQLRHVARMLGTPHMPWQDHLARVASEHHPDRPRQYRYPVVVVTVPRQAGKTQEFTVVQIDRSIRHPRHLTYTTAQTGLSAKDLWKTGILAAVDPVTADELGTTVNPRLAALVRKIDRSAGSPGVRWTNGSLVAPFAPGPKCLDGKRKVSLLGVDEAFSHDDVSGNDLMGSIGATQTVADWRQLWIFSTKGGRRSTWLNGWIATGRQATTNPDATVAYFESAADPDCDPENPASLAFHPAIGHTTTLEALWADRVKYSLAEWRRGYLNLDAEEGTEFALDPTTLSRLGGVHPAQLPALENVALAVDLAIDRSAATIAAAWPDPDRAGHVLVCILASRPGIEWVPEVLARLDAAGPRVIRADPTGPTRSLIADLAAADHALWLDPSSTRDYASACQWTLDAIAAGRLHHDDTPTLTDQARDLVVKNLGGAIAFDVHNSTGPIDSLRAVALAAHYAATQPMTDQVL